MALLGDILSLYRDGDINASLPQLGQVAGRIDVVETVAEVIARTVAEFDGGARRRSAHHYLADAQHRGLTLLPDQRCPCAA